MNLGLTEEFQSQLNSLIAACSLHDVVMKPYFGLRDPVEQAKLWRQSRSAEEIEIGRKQLLTARAPFLAQCLDAAGTQGGSWATNALPGESWHQYGIACDCFWEVKGQPIWTATPEDPDDGYLVFATEATRLGLTTLGKIGDWGHVQQPSAASPLHLYSLEKIDEIMRGKFGPEVKGMK